MSTVESLRLAGNDKFKEGDFAAAAELYEQGLAAVAESEKLQNHSTGAVQVELAADKLKLLNNLSTCRRKLKQFGPALDAATRAVAADPKSAKSRLLRSVLVAEKSNAAESQQSDDVKPSVGDAAALLSVLSDASIAALLEPATVSQLIVAFEHVAKLLLLSCSPKNGAAKAVAAPAAPAALQIAPTTSTGDDLGVFAASDAGTVIQRGTTIFDCSATLPFSVGVYAETVSAGFVPADEQPSVSSPVKKNTTVCTCCGRCREESAGSAASNIQIFPCNACGLAAFCEACVSGAASKAWCSERHRNFECHRMQKLMAMFALAEQQQREGSDELLELGSHVISTIASIEFRTQQEHQKHPENVTPAAADVDFLLSLKGDGQGSSQLQHTHGRELQLIHSIFEDEIGDADAKKVLVNKVAGICLCNSFGCSDSSGLPSCQLLFATPISRLNHSCAPNCEFDSGTRTVKTIADVPAGSQFCISYIANLHYPTAQRREQIRNRFFFHCECARCGCVSSSSSSSSGSSEWMLTASNKEDGSAEMEAALIRTHEPVVQNIVEFARARAPEEVTRELLVDLQQRQAALEKDLKRTHFLVHDLRNAVTFCASALDDATAAFLSSRDEWLMWEMLFPGVALPAKRDKLRNMILSASSSSISDEALKTFAKQVATPMLAYYEQE